ncbi:SDR family NAD(P)-dependent oxidoreductase [Botrimarina sp.]|uniref:SDR family NAD(P)-dependent oxidoreductase n=1 Tax=Botrimarina sp. TaxID=2795802 RepID=UPI0032EEB8B0
MIRLDGSRALVTGASGGVGRRLAVRLAEAGADVVLVARREEELHRTAEQARRAGRSAVVVAGDITLAEDRSRALQAASDELGGLDVLVNNAGVGAHGRFHDSSPDRLRAVFELNFFAAAELTRAAVPLLEKSDSACVANIGSVLAWRGVPHTSEYCASKFALRGWSEAIRPELRRLGIHVLHASPSTIRTEFREHLIERKESVPWGGRGGVSPDRVARRVVHGIRRGRNEVAIVWEDWAIVRAARAAPWLLDRALRRYG